MKELDLSAERLVRGEKRNIALLIAHLSEISRRKGELERGYKNCFDYCVRRLRLSEGSVARRLQVANVSRRFPQILVALAENRMSLTVAGLLAPHVTEENVEKLLSNCAGKAKREVEEYLVGLKPKPVFVASIRRNPSLPKESKRTKAAPTVENAAPAPPPASPPSSSRRGRRSSTFGFPPTRRSSKSSRGWPKSSASRTLKRTWRRFFARP